VAAQFFGISDNDSHLIFSLGWLRSWLDRARKISGHRCHVNG
jgi:hypothetical protein